MKSCRIFMLLFATAFLFMKGYGNHKPTSESGIKNPSEKIYIKPSKLYFSEEGIFLKTSSDEWQNLDYVCHDAHGYYLVKKNNLDPKTPERVHRISNISSNDFPNSMKTTPNDMQEFYTFEELIENCGNRVSPQPKMWKCPYCGQWWLMGEKCRNKDCPTNQWEKQEES